jgi:hypothetical protein
LEEQASQNVIGLDRKPLSLGLVLVLHHSSADRHHQHDAVVDLLAELPSCVIPLVLIAASNSLVGSQKF